MAGREATAKLLHPLAEAVVTIVNLVGALERLDAAIGCVVDVGRGVAGTRFPVSVLAVRYTQNQADSYFIG